MLPDSGLTETIPVVFTAEAERDLNDIFAGGWRRNVHALRTYDGRPQKFRDCVEQVLYLRPWLDLRAAPRHVDVFARSGRSYSRIPGQRTKGVAAWLIDRVLARVRANFASSSMV